MLAFGVIPIFLLRDIGSGMIFTNIGTVLATEPALLNRLCFLVIYAVATFYIIGAYSAKIDMFTPALWREFNAFGRSYICAPRPIIMTQRPIIGVSR